LFYMNLTFLMETPTEKVFKIFLKTNSGTKRYSELFELHSYLVKHSQEILPKFPPKVHFLHVSKIRFSSKISQKQPSRKEEVNFLFILRL
jgi:hypothetical protein